MPELKVFLWAKHTGGYGAPVPARVVEDRGEDSPDFWMWIGTRQQLTDSALAYIQEPSVSVYHTRCAYSVLKSIGVDVAYKTQDATGDYIKGWDDDGAVIRTPSSEEAETFLSWAEANSYLHRTTDRVVIDII